VGTDGIEAMLQIVSPLVQKLQPGTPVLYVHDGTDEKFSSAMMEQLRTIGGRDVASRDQLWNAIGNH
jgi:hypothetical protein